jgi:wyosine [tRNA(Phe)-imidazoG37] synthetase (radical SAM superfamily)
VITNASLIWRRDVQQDLRSVDWVSLKVDAVEPEIWRRVDRPHGRLDLPSILEGALEFAAGYRGCLVTETMLVAGLNDGEEHLVALGGYLARLRPSVAYLSIPTRPPAEGWVRAPDEESLNRAYQRLSQDVAHVEYLAGYEGNAFAFSGDVERDLLSITAVHPMRQDAVSDYLARAGADWLAVRRLLARGELVEVKYSGHSFYLRRLAPGRPGYRAGTGSGGPNHVN